VFLYGSVLEKFLGLYASVNSFSQMVARVKGGDRPIKRWAPRAGEEFLL
jgi:type VI secretion system protein ImpG